MPAINSISYCFIRTIKNRKNNYTVNVYITTPVQLYKRLMVYSTDIGY